MDGLTLVLWIGGAFVAVWITQHVLAMRTLLMLGVRRGLAVTRIEASDLPPTERDHLSSLNTQLATLGFSQIGFGEVPHLLTAATGPSRFAVYLHRDRTVFAVVSPRPHPEFGKLVDAAFESFTRDGRHLGTAFLSLTQIGIPDLYEVECVANASVPDRLKRHLERIAEASDVVSVDHEPLEFLFDTYRRDFAAMDRRLRSEGFTASTPDSSLDRLTLKWAWHFARGARRMNASSAREMHVEVERQPSEADRQGRVTADQSAFLALAPNPERPDGGEQPLRALMLATLVLSFAAFAAIWNVATAAIILGVIAVHETGHAVAMRACGYRDINVFFVPFLGALAVGRQTEASATARITVALAGPVPGMWIAVLLALTLPADELPLLKAVVFALLIINAINLLPFTPLDGGRVAEALLPRDGVGRVALHVVSAAGLMAFAIWLKEPIVGLIALWLAIGLPRHLQYARFSRLVGARLTGAHDRATLYRAVSEEMAKPPFDRWPFMKRLTMAKALEGQRSLPIASNSERIKGAIAYASSWVPALIGMVLYARL